MQDFLVTLHNRNGDGEQTAETDVTLHIYSSSQQFRKCLGNAQSETESFLCVCIFKSAEWGKDAFHLFFTHARSCIMNLDSHSIGLIRNSDFDSAFLRELDGIRQDVTGDLQDSLAVTHDYGVITHERAFNLDILHLRYRLIFNQQ